MRAFAPTMLLPALPLALWGAWLARASVEHRWWIGVALAGVALATAGGLLFLKPWVQYLAYIFAAVLSVSWVYAVWQVILRGWPYSDRLSTVISLLPGACLLVVCVGGSHVVYVQYRHKTRAAPPRRSGRPFDRPGDPPSG